MSARKAVILDLFGTRVEAMRYAGYQRMLADMAGVLGAPPAAFVREWEATLNRRFAGEFATIEANLEHICVLLGLEAEAGRLAAGAEIRKRIVQPILGRPRPEALPTLAALRARGLKVGLITDCTPDTPDRWAESPLAPHVDAPVFSSVVRMKKPDPRIYALACARLGVAPAEVLYVGDGGSGELTGATACGMKAVLLRTPAREDALLHRSEAATWSGAAINTLSEVPGHL